MPYNPPADSDVLTATLLLNDVWNQAIAQVTSGSRPTGTEGQVIYETDTGAFQAHDGSGWVEFGRITGATTWTPQIDQGASTNIAKTIATAFYIRTGNVVTAWANLALTAAGTAGSNVTVTLPVAPSSHAASDVLGAGQCMDASLAANCGPVSVGFNSGSQVFFRITAAATGAWGSLPSFALASGDTIRFQVTYRVA